MRIGEVNVITLGCSKNLIDSERLMRMFAKAGYSVRHDPKRITGEVVVVNTCGFIASAQEESINTILGLIEAKNKGQIGKVFVMGCLGERFRNELEKELPEVDGIYGKFDWKQILTQLGLGHHAMLGERLVSTPRHYAYLKIAEGCNQKCSYCAIPLITGRMKSRTIESIKQEVEQLTKQGCSEFQLVAQDLTSYGKDLDSKKPLLHDLLATLSDIPKVKWLRLHYAYPTLFPYDILPLIRERRNICKYLDIALQHASDKMLKLMRRGITRVQTEELIERIRQNVPNIALRTTFIVGHPGETDKDFEELIEFTEKMRFERMGAFPYSHEQDTYSFNHYSDDVPEALKINRYEKLMATQLPIGEAFSQSLVGTCERIVVDRYEGNYYIGRTQYDSPEVDPEVIIPRETCTKKLRHGSYYTMEIIDTEGFDLIAKPL